MVIKRPRPLFIRLLREVFYSIKNPLTNVYNHLFHPDVPGVKTFVFNHDKLLLVRIGYAHKSWVLPRGKIDRGETPLMAAVRETKEETGIVLTNVKFLVLKHYHSQGKHVDLSYFIANTEVEDIIIDCQEIIDAGWFALDELPKNIRPRLEEEIKLLKEKTAE